MFGSFLSGRGLCGVDECGGSNFLVNGADGVWYADWFKDRLLSDLLGGCFSDGLGRPVTGLCLVMWWIFNIYFKELSQVMGSVQVMRLIRLTKFSSKELLSTVVRCMVGPWEFNSFPISFCNSLSNKSPNSVYILLMFLYCTRKSLTSV